MADATHLAPYKWKKGSSGNPMGRPSQRALWESMVGSNMAEATKTLLRQLKSTDDHVAFRAAEFIYTYVLGRPVEGQAKLAMEVMMARATEVLVEAQGAPAALGPEAPAMVETAPEEQVVSEVSVATGATEWGTPAALAQPEPPAPQGVAEEQALSLEELAAKVAEKRTTPTLDATVVLSTLTDPANAGVTVQALDELLARTASRSATIGLQCQYRTLKGRCQEQAADASTWCETHKAQLMGLVSG